VQGRRLAGAQELAAPWKPMDGAAVRNPAAEAGWNTDCAAAGFDGDAAAAAAAAVHNRPRGHYRNHCAVAAGAVRTAPRGGTGNFRSRRALDVAAGATRGGPGSRPSTVLPAKKSAFISLGGAGNNRPVQAPRGYSTRGISIAKAQNKGRNSKIASLRRTYAGRASGFEL
jgi:hypothetical protein